MNDLQSSKSLGFRGVARLATAIGAVAVGAFAIGALTIRRLTIRRVSIENADFKSLSRHSGTHRETSSRIGSCRERLDRTT